LRCSREAAWTINNPKKTLLSGIPRVVLGLDLSGIVVAIGRGVRGIAVGDSVVAMADLNGDGGWVAPG
jgi:NADPH:quinone reductase-like Zn-dependent oxidoreductase